jgi:hypothetical protein
VWPGLLKIWILVFAQNVARVDMRFLPLFRNNAVAKGGDAKAEDSSFD